MFVACEILTLTHAALAARCDASYASPLSTGLPYTYDGELGSLCDI